MTEETARNEDLIVIPAQGVQALAYGLFALHDLLVEKGLIELGEVSDNLRRLRLSDPKSSHYLAELIEGFAKYQFNPEGTFIGGPKLVFDSGSDPGQ